MLYVYLTYAAKNVNRIVKHKRKDSGVKRPLSAYNLFVKEKYEEVKKQSPPGQAPPFKEIFSQVAEMWKKLSPSEKEKYNAKCAALNAAGEEGAAAEPAKEEEHETSEDVPKKKKKVRRLTDACEFDLEWSSPGNHNLF